MERSSDRRGFSLIVIVLIVLLVAVVMIFSHNTLTRHVHGETIRILLGQNAQATARLLLTQAYARVASAVTEPDKPSYREVRRRLASTPVAQTVDLTDVVGSVDARPALLWRRKRSPEFKSVGSIVSAQMNVVGHSLSPFPVGSTGGVGGSLGSPDERLGIVRLEAMVRVKLSGMTVTRRLAESREMKLVLSGPPRPFDQLWLYIDDAVRVTDQTRSRAVRQRLLDAAERLRAILSKIGPGLSAEIADKIAKVKAGLLSGENLGARLRSFPEGACALVGITTAKDPMDLGGLDLSGTVGPDQDSFEKALGELSKLIDGPPVSDGGKSLWQKVVQAVTAFNQASTKLWEYGRRIKTVDRSTSDFVSRIQPYESRLSPSYFASRVSLDFDSNGELFRQWRSGRRALMGVFRLRSGTPLAISGPSNGRAVLLVNAPKLTLSSIPGPSKPRELLTIVVDSTPVVIVGSVHAALVLSKNASLEIAAGAKLRGSLMVQGLRGKLNLSGSLVPGSDSFAGITLDEALAMPGWGSYGLALSPVPLWTEGVRDDLPEAR